MRCIENQISTLNERRQEHPLARQFCRFNSAQIYLFWQAKKKLLILSNIKPLLRCGAPKAIMTFARKAVVHRELEGQKAARTTLLKKILAGLIVGKQRDFHRIYLPYFTAVFIDAAV